MIEARVREKRRLSRPTIGGTVLGAVLLLAGCGSSDPIAVGDDDPDVTATYTVTFEATWSAGTHPSSFPPNPHFSGLVGATHSSSAVLWASGGLATSGIKSMAETGSKSALINEVEAAIQAGTAQSVLSGNGINPAPGSTSLTFTTHENHSQVTLVTMIAPSPDWFVGVHGLELRENGEWIGSLTVDLLPYDAGTDSGQTYTSPNAAMVPAGPISRLTDSPFDGSVPLGRFVFVRQ